MSLNSLPVLETALSHRSIRRFKTTIRARALRVRRYRSRRLTAPYVRSMSLREVPSTHPVLSLPIPYKDKDKLDVCVLSTRAQHLYYL